MQLQNRGTIGGVDNSTAATNPVPNGMGRIGYLQIEK